MRAGGDPVFRDCHDAEQRRGGVSTCSNPGSGFILMTMLTLTRARAFIMWLGEQIPSVASVTACGC